MQEENPHCILPPLREKMCQLCQYCIGVNDINILFEDVIICGYPRILKRENRPQ
jgi:hypothetical protein